MSSISSCPLGEDSVYYYTAIIDTNTLGAYMISDLVGAMHMYNTYLSIIIHKIEFYLLYFDDANRQVFEVDTKYTSNT